MFSWNIAKSAEAVFSRWALKRVFKFFLKKKLGQFILGDIDLDQLDVQLREGTIQLSDLALNIDFLNDKLGTPLSLVIKEGSIGSLLVRMPWKGKGCEVEVDEFELVLGPCGESCSSKDNDTHSSSRESEENMRRDYVTPEKEMLENVNTSSPADVHEGVKTIAKMVKWLLTSFSVKIKNLIIAFDPSLGKGLGKNEPLNTIVLRLAEIECGTRVSEDMNAQGDAAVESFLGICRLTNFVTFQGAVLELLLVNDLDQYTCNSSAYGRSDTEVFPPTNAKTPIMLGERGGVSGNMKLSIPWKNGSLDMKKVNADICIDPIEFRFQPSTIKWFLCLMDTVKNLNKGFKNHPQYKPLEKTHLTSVSCCPSSAAEPSYLPTMLGQNSKTISTDPSLMGQESAFEVALPHLISDWVPFSASEEETDFGASVDQFFECLDGLRNSQSALGGSGVYNWTCSVFSAITAASSLASGSLRVPSEQQHIEANLKAAVAGVSIMIYFHDEEKPRFCDLNLNQGTINSADVHYMGTECRDILFDMQVCPQDVKIEATVNYVEIADYVGHETIGLSFGTECCADEVCASSLAIKQLQEEVQSSLPSLAPSLKANDLIVITATEVPNKIKDDLIKTTLLKTSGSVHCKFTGSLADGSLTGPMSFSLSIPPFVLWVNFCLMIKFFNFIEEIENGIETGDVGSEYSPEMDKDFRKDSRHLATLPSGQRLLGNIYIPNGRIILCFPIHTRDAPWNYYSWDQFIAFDLYSPLTSKKDMGESMNAYPDANIQKGISSTNTSSLHVNVGSVDMYLVKPAFEDKDEKISSCLIQGPKFFSQKILSVTSSTGCSVVSIIWQGGPVTGPWVAERARCLAVSGESNSSIKRMGRGYEFASMTRMRNLGDSDSEIRQEIIVSSGFLLHLHLSPLIINLSSSQYEDIMGILNQITNGPGCMANGTVGAQTEAVLTQTSIHVECDSVEIVIFPSKLEDVSSSIQNELHGSWSRIKLLVKKLELLQVSNIGGLDGASFFWLGHEEGKLWGSVTALPDHDFLLITCCNSILHRGDGGGSNALSTGLAGIDIVYFWDPKDLHGYTSITVRCGTVVAPGGRLDWVGLISSFFVPPSSGAENLGETSLPKENDEDRPSCGSFFSLNLVDVGLSYEPYLKNLVVNSENFGTDSRHSSVQGVVHEPFMAGLLAASSINFSNAATGESVENVFNIRVQDLGLLLCQASKVALVDCTYSAQHLRKSGYVKVAHDPLILAELRSNCRNDSLWELECFDSHVDIGTCSDTTSGLIQLIVQLQQLFAPDMEESLVHLQTRWNNMQMGQESILVNGEMKMASKESPLSNFHVQKPNLVTESKIGLMDEICQDAFLIAESQICTGKPDSETAEESLCGEACHFGTEVPQMLYRNHPISGSTPFVGSANNQTSFLPEGCFPELIEGYCFTDPCPASDLAAQNLLKSELKNVLTANIDRTNSGWYDDAALRIVEDHISETCEESCSKQFVEEKYPNFSSGKPQGHVLIRNINVKWRMYAGSDWVGTRMNCHNQSYGRDTAVCLELVLSGMECQYKIFLEGGFCVSELSLSVCDIHLYDSSKEAPLRQVLGYYCSKDHPRESSSKELTLKLEAVRPEPSIPLEEYRLAIAVLPMRLHLHQRQLDFLISFFGKNNSSDSQSPGSMKDLSGSGSSSDLAQNDSSRHMIEEEALLPYFQKFYVRPVLLRVDYIPEHVDLAALRGGKYVELVNLVPWKGIELHLKHVNAVGVYGWNNVFETIIGEWLEDISQNQIHNVLRAIPPIRSLTSVGTGATKLISCPVENYKKDHRLIKGVQRGTIAFLRSVSLEAIALGVHLAASAHDILLQAEYILAGIPSSAPWPAQSRTIKNVRSNQPRDAQQGIQQAYESLSDGLGKSASALVQSPLKKIQRGAGVGAAISTAFWAVPAATVAPVSACASALHCALLGVRNSLDPDHKKESMEKYMGPSLPQE